MTFRRWDLVSVPFPFIEGHDSKRRPALVVSTESFHAAHKSCFAAMVTTARGMQDLRPDDIAIADWAKTGLPTPCVIRLARLATFETSSIRRIGSLAVRERNAVAALLKRWFAA